MNTELDCDWRIRAGQSCVDWESVRLPDTMSDRRANIGWPFAARGSRPLEARDPAAAAVIDDVNSNYNNNKMILLIMIVMTTMITETNDESSDNNNGNANSIIDY